jgi:acetaldehyde dehydrogenase
VKKIKVAILGSGNIGSDLTERLLIDPHFEVIALVGRDKTSTGLERFRDRVPFVVSEGIDGFIPNLSEVEGIFDATSAQSASHNWRVARDHGKWLIDLTPSKLGTAFVPSIAGKVAGIELSPDYSHNYSMVTCGGQSAGPIVHAMSSLMDKVDQVEVSSSIAAKSAGIATRNNLDHYIETTEDLLIKISNCKQSKAVLVLNPSTPTVPMRTTVTVNGTGATYEDLLKNVISEVSKMQQINPGYELIGNLVKVNAETYSATIRVTGAGHFLPSYAGNLDIINSAAVITAKMHSHHHQLENSQ